LDPNSEDGPGKIWPHKKRKSSKTVGTLKNPFVVPQGDLRKQLALKNKLVVPQRGLRKQLAVLHLFRTKI
jgi:hypothetical protein